MGFFSWKTSDTQRSIANRHSNRDTFTVYMKDDLGNTWQEDDYDGYGRFGGKDFYILLAEMNGISTGDDENDRNSGISLMYENNRSGSGSIATKLGVKIPILVEDKDLEWESTAPPEDCPEQGFFYG